MYVSPWRPIGWSLLLALAACSVAAPAARAGHVHVAISNNYIEIIRPGFRDDEIEVPIYAQLSIADGWSFHEFDSATPDLISFPLRSTPGEPPPSPQFDVVIIPFTAYGVYRECVTLSAVNDDTGVIETATAYYTVRVVSAEYVPEPVSAVPFGLGMLGVARRYARRRV